MALCGCSREPLHGFGLVFGHALAVIIACTYHLQSAISTDNTKALRKK